MGVFTLTSVLYFFAFSQKPLFRFLQGGRSHEEALEVSVDCELPWASCKRAAKQAWPQADLGEVQDAEARRKSSRHCFFLPNFALDTFSVPGQVLTPPLGAAGDGPPSL